MVAFYLSLVKDNSSSQLVIRIFFYGLWRQIPAEGVSSFYWCSCYSVLSIFTFQLKSLILRRIRDVFFCFFFFFKKNPYSITHTFVFQPTQSCLRILGSHFELFPFTSYNLCFLNILLNWLQANCFCISSYQSIYPSGSLIFFLVYFIIIILLF